MRVILTKLPVTVSRVLFVAATFGAACSTAQTIHNFSGPDGDSPFGGLAVGKNGTLYGMTESGGNSPECSNCGAVYELTPPTSSGGAWVEKVIYSFTDPQHQQALPLSTPALGSNGELYGTTYNLGSMQVGSVFELTPPASPSGKWIETTLYSFSNTPGSPQNPEAGVVIGKNGVLYGTAVYETPLPNAPDCDDIISGCGAVYSLTPPASPGGAWTEQTLHTFEGGSDGYMPLAGLVFGGQGELYGTTYYGGGSSTCIDRYAETAGCGTVFRLSPPTVSGGEWTYSVLYRFMGRADGGFPNAVVYQNGALYGTVTFGGDLTYCGGVGCGGVFELKAPQSAGGSWTETVIYSFKGVPDGLYPAAGPVIGSNGRLYGTTRDGGNANSCPENPGCGVVYELIPPSQAGGAWQEEVLHRFAATDGYRPTASVVIGKNGDLYGTTLQGGQACAPYGCGTVFEVQVDQ